MALEALGPGETTPSGGKCRARATKTRTADIRQQTIFFLTSAPGRMRLHFCAAVLLLLLRSVTSSSIIVACADTCKTSLDCSLNGACGAGGVCECDQGWTGRCCGSLNLAPVDYANTGGGYRHPSTSTWGGNIFRNASTGRFSMLIAEMKPAGTPTDPGAGSCGLTTWGSNSQITHVEASSLGGPYTRKEVAVPVWAHNPIVRQAPDGTLVLWHIGGGGAPANATPPKGYCALNGTSPCGEQSFDHCGPPVDPCAFTPKGFSCHANSCMGAGGDCGTDLAEPTLPCNASSWADCVPAAAAACAATPGCKSFAMSAAWQGLNKAKLFGAGAAPTGNAQWTSWTSAAADAAGCTLQLHSAPGTAGPWTPYPAATITPCAGNNPGPWVHPNGTIYIVFTEHGMGLWRADTWRGPYTLVTSGACGGGEDPSLFLNPRGEWHCLYHRAPFSNPNVAIGHSYSPDGYQWFTAADPAANSTVRMAGGGVLVHGKRERPHVVYLDGELVAFVSGVGLVPQCNPFNQARYDPAADCSATTQYQLLDSNSPGGWTDSTYTLVQEVVR